MHATGSESSRSMGSVISAIGEVAGEVKAGKWNNKEDALSDKIQDLLQKSQRFDKEPTVDKPTHEAFMATISKLEDALGNLAHKTEKVKSTIQALSFIKGSSPTNEASTVKTAEVNPELTKRLPCHNDHAIQASLGTFRDYLQKNIPGAPAALAQWISYNQIPLEKLHLTPTEFQAIAPHLTFLSLNTSAISAKELGEYLPHCTNLRALILEHDGISKLPSLPSHLQQLTVHGDQLEEITTLREGLKYFDCSSNPNLKTFQKELPESLEEFHMRDCPEVRVLPTLNRQLKVFDCSHSEKVFLPNQLNEGLEQFKCRNVGLTYLPVLPPNLKNIDCSENEQLTYISKLPDSLIELDCSKCGNLESGPSTLPKGLKKIYMSWSSKFQLPQERPNNLQIIK